MKKIFSVIIFAIGGQVLSTPEEQEFNTDDVTLKVLEPNEVSYDKDKKATLKTSIVKDGVEYKTDKSLTEIDALLVEKAEEAVVENTVDYSKMKVEDLKKLCTEKGLTFEDGAKKDDLVKLLSAAPNESKA